MEAISVEAFTSSQLSDTQRQCQPHQWNIPGITQYHLCMVVKMLFLLRLKKHHKQSTRVSSTVFG